VKRMIQQYMTTADVARKMFRSGCPGRGEYRTQRERDAAGAVEGVDYCYGIHMGHGPSITWLAGLVVCEARDGCGDISYPEWEGRRQPCSDCDTLGYPPAVEVVSYETFMAGDGENAIRCTVHGRLALGTPVAVVSEVVDGECIVIGGNGYYHLPEYRGHPSDEYDITDAVAGTLIPGGVAYPIEVVG